jgi:hypothetical protein
LLVAVVTDAILRLDVPVANLQLMAWYALDGLYYACASLFLCFFSPF